MSQCIVRSRDLWEFLPFYNATDKHMSLGLCKETVKSSTIIEIDISSLHNSPLFVV